MARRIIYRDYRAGRKGQFASKETFNRSRGQGVTCHVHREFVKKPNIIEDIDDLYDIEDESDLEPQEFHGTGDTGRRTE